MGTFVDWFLGGPANPPKNNPTILPWGGSHKDFELHHFTVFLPEELAPSPQGIPVDPEPIRMTDDPRVYFG